MFWRAVDNMAERSPKRPKPDKVQIDDGAVLYLDKYPGQTWSGLEEYLRYGITG